MADVLSRTVYCSVELLSACPKSHLFVTTPAIRDTILVVDPTPFELGRYVRLNPGHHNEEEVRVVGFGRPLTPAEQLALKEEEAP